MIAGRYTREREIGRGGMGAVWLGRDEVLGRPVAIKGVGVLPGDASPDLARAEREAKIAASLNHPHIVGVFDLVAEDGQLWMIMEYVEGRTLSELVRANGPLTPDDAAPIIAQAASALAAAHANGVVHRDVKPSNILVREDGHVKLTDFGIARGQADAALTQTGLVTGSPAYLAPEVASGQQATAASDVWSLGATLFHALAGHPPYDTTDNVLGALYRIVNEAPPRIDDAGALAPLLEATMTRAPQQRWTMDDIGRFLSAAEDGPADPGATTAVAPMTEIMPVELAAAPAPDVIPGMIDTSPTGSTSTAGARRAESDHRSALPAVITVLIAALVIAIVVIALQNDPQDNLAADPGSDPSTSAGTSASPEPSSPTTEPSKEPTQKELKNFIDSYLSLASSDPKEGFMLLTPAFQQASSRYEEFWGSVSNPTLLDFSADTSELTVSYTYSYQRQGFGRQVDPVQLQLVTTGDGFLIAGPL